MEYFWGSFWDHFKIVLDSGIVFGKVFVYSSGEAYFCKDMGIGVHSCTCGKMVCLALAKVFLSSPGKVFLSSPGDFEVFSSSHGEVGGRALESHGRRRLPPPPWSAPRLADV